jgi:sigma-54 dependent transcriptional regulator, acetoin dehydrogenase operon transcriptional activator AcoR
LVNRSVTRLLSKDQNTILNTSIDDLLSSFKYKTSLVNESYRNSSSSSIYEYSGKQFLIQKIPVVNEYGIRHIYTFREIARIQRLEKDVRLHLAQKGYITKYGFDDIWTVSKAINDLKEKARGFAATEKNMLLTGESGTGKELFAHSIHQNSSRHAGPFVAVNFAGIPEGLIESELFGYEAGAFTGAKKTGKMGLFEEAHGGTIFLDEIGDAPLSVQSRLLRVIQEREIMRVGSSRITPIDVRILAGTNRNLLQAMEENRFRKDLFYRLNTLPLEIPPLRKHPEDIPYIMHRYLQERYGVRKIFSQQATTCLLQYSWPGNIRELINLAEYISISTPKINNIELEHLPESFSEMFAEYRKDVQKTIDDSNQLILKHLQNSTTPLESVASLLGILRQRKGLITGRSSLIREMLLNNHFITEGRMKQILKLLKAAGLIRVGTTKQGTALTKNGEEFFDYLAASG